MGEMSRKCYSCEQLQAMLDTENHYMKELGKELTDADAKIKHLQAENDALKVQMKRLQESALKHANDPLLRLEE